MADVMERPATRPDRKSRTTTVVINGEFIRVQAAEALATFFAPFNGVVNAASGKTRRRAAMERTRRDKS